MAQRALIVAWISVAELPQLWGTSEMVGAVVFVRIALPSVWFGLVAVLSPAFLTAARMVAADLVQRNGLACCSLCAWRYRCSASRRSFTLVNAPR